MKKTIFLFFLILYSSITLAGVASKPSSHEPEHKNINHKSINHKNNNHKNKGKDKYDDHDDESHHEKEGHGHHDEGVSEIDNAMAHQAGIVSHYTAQQTLSQTSTSYGRLTTAPEHTSHVRARFPGVIRSVAVNIGDKVNTGDLLAIVESNESLKRYEVRAPIRGTVIQRHANAGEMTLDQVLFSITSFESLWAELHIFPNQQKSLNIGQVVHIRSGDQVFKTRISHLLPAEDASPYLIARAKIDKNQEHWFPGLMVKGEIIINTFDARLAVKKSALQTLGGRTGIFVKEQDNYRFTALALGRSDNEFVEVLSGVQLNTLYVIENSYLIKADIEKSEAEHVH